VETAAAFTNCGRFPITVSTFTAAKPAALGRRGVAP